MLKRWLEGVCHCPESASQTPRMAVVMQRACSGVLQFIMVMGPRSLCQGNSRTEGWIHEVCGWCDDPQWWSTIVKKCWLFYRYCHVPCGAQRGRAGHQGLWVPRGKIGSKKPLPDHVTIVDSPGEIQSTIFILGQTGSHSSLPFSSQSIRHTRAFLAAGSGVWILLCKDL